MARRKTAARRRLLAWGACAALPLLLAAAVVWRAERTLSGFVLGGLGESFSTKVFSAPTEIGAAFPRDARLLRERLRRLHYRPVEEPAAPGEYSWAPERARVFLRGFSSPPPAQAPGLYAVEFGPDGSTAVSDASGAPAPAIRLEPELVAELSGTRKIRREPAPRAEIPDALADAVVAVEDKRFRSHWGLDPRAILRAVRNDLLGRGELQGGSTITQQLAKNLFLTPRRTLRRKLMEAAFSLYLELRMSKERILTLYLNHIYMGQDGPVAVAGMKAAADFYFGKTLARLSLGECAMLAGLIRSPYLYNPRRNPDAATNRRDFVLRRMHAEGAITAAELRRALEEPLRPVPRPIRERRGSDYFTAEVVRQLLTRYGEEEVFRHGLNIHTTMDPLLQNAAERLLRRGPHQAALVALEPAGGRVLALVGGRDFVESPYNRATQARRQPGSAFKPFFYGAALEQGYTPATILEDRPRTFAGQAGDWTPRNYDGVYLGTTTLRSALAHSLNAATLDLAGQLGPEAAAEFARRMGVSSPLEATLALALGSSEVGLLELTAAYAPFANGGWRVEPTLVACVQDAAGGMLEYASGARNAALDPTRAYLMTSLLQSVVAEGTAASLARLGFARPCAGKTGTTDEGRDAWFVGYTPRLLAGVWAGDDRNRALRLSGAKDALPLWAAFMSRADEGPAQDFARPEGLIGVDIDPLSGLRARSGCPQRRSELFAAGTEPREDCPLHSGGALGWFKRLFRRH